MKWKHALDVDCNPYLEKNMYTRVLNKIYVVFKFDAIPEIIAASTITKIIALSP